MAKPATHIGHCQLCGREQKLPGGRLSKHGYTVRWSFFEGVCPGAEHLPYELAKNLLQGALESVEARIIDLYAEARSAREETEFFWVSEYHGAERRGGRTVQSYWAWETYPLGSLIVSTYDGGERGKVEYVSKYHRKYDNDVTREEQVACYGNDSSPAGVVAQLNERRSQAFIAEAKQHEEYANWLALRIEEWKPDQPLKPVA